MKKFLILSFGIFLMFGNSAFAQTGSEQIKKYYDKAFEFYVQKQYSRAIENWNLILKLDSKQITAKNMIERARKKMKKTWGAMRKNFYKLMARGKYAAALLSAERLLALDGTNPGFIKLKKRLEKITPIIQRVPSKTKAWRMASLGIYNYANENENLPLAYDALRYAEELAPKNKYFPKLKKLLEDDAPQLKINDSKLSGTSVVEYKKTIALQYIYNSQFYLAAKELKNVLILEPDDLMSLKRLGSVYLKLKKYGNAMKIWKKALKINPGDAQLKEYIKALDSIKKGKK